ncbi:MAG: hypothetical protein Q8L08_11085 [Candidatus Nanopelagicaceae bacterium]|nr:hypothetical protein [Candidatus Nanopelagicaceae bacterium]
MKTSIKKTAKKGSGANEFSKSGIVLEMANKIRLEYQAEFLESNMDNLIGFAAKNQDKKGFVKVWVDEDFDLQFPPDFILKKIYKDSYNTFHWKSDKKSARVNSKNIQFAFFEIMWSDNKTIWKIKIPLNINTKNK